MTENNVNREFLFSIYVENNYIKELERILEIKIKNIKVSQKSNRMSMQGMSLDGQEIKISWQLDNDFKKQIIRIQNLILFASNNKKTIIIYGAFEFDESINQELLQYVTFFNDRNIKLVILKINHECMAIISNKKLDNPFVKNPFVSKKEITIYNKNYKR
ncbi:hypothetical protein [Clostridium beijerinckii]|uniref:Uncharacterized protein n=1 Tax=Clostridium beijerinckii TaxID=1520 RepID=A0AAW3W750_CLOBE|nr:hypothetical protein [Clostridium beijerinckii]MBC2457526.1 hypothetical protein [Clostridium beijerinckii]MBC2474649.1 hypothetical protein [Clostridium beijerinckii]NOV62394.1 hypothetical protein [Clostridium beijerinckii]NOV68109.1 hypothetical protein [Clostridium beijerinckii]NOW30446.1 hypothetical protein [Clostridium beijerinckii]